MTSGPTHQKMAADIWAVADLLRGDYKRHEYGQVILPFTVLRRLDAVMAPTREAVRAKDAGARHPEQAAAARTRGEAPLLQHLQAGLRVDRGRRAEHREEPAGLHRRLLRERAEDPRPVRARQPDHQAGRGAAAASGRRQVRRHAGPGQAVQPRHGLRLRAPDPAVRRCTPTRPPGSTSPPAKSST